MKIKFYAVKDLDVGFMQPQAFMNDKVAVRSFISAVRDKRANQVNQYPEKMYFYKVGEFDDQTGAYENKLQELARASFYVDQFGEEEKKE